MTDVGGPDQEQRLADFVTKSIEDTSSTVSVKEAMKKIGLKDKHDIIPGLEVRLLSHQCIGVAWMLQKERCPDKGGIMADDMGLGKTVQMIATMALNPPQTEDECQTTLIVVPAALLQQWKEEIETKTNGLFTVHIHHSKDKLKAFSQVKSKDVVITSYQTLCQDFAIPRSVEPEDELEWLQKNGGILSKIKFYRVVADEAQFIRNRATRASVSLSYIRSTYRWMLTGTPVTNTLADIYGLLRFGRFRPWNDWAAFNEHVAKVQFEDAPLAGSRAQAILKPILLRRTKNSTLDGEPLLQLPVKDIQIVNLQFTQAEQDIYDYFEGKTKLRVNKFINENTLVKNHAFVLVLILRLRQLCCHPYLTLSLTNGFEDPGMLVAGEAERERSRAKKIMGAEWVNELRERFMKREINQNIMAFADEVEEGDSTCPNCQDLFTKETGRILVCGHTICFDCTLELMNSPIVHDGVFGTGNEKENLAVEKEYELGVARGWRPCPTCKQMMDMKSNDKVFKTAAFEPTDEEIQEFKHNRRVAARSKAFKNKVKMPRSPTPASPASSIPDELPSDSDDDLPDIAHMHDSPRKLKKGKAKAKSKVISSEDEDVEMIDMTPSSRAKKRKIALDSSDEEIDSISHGKKPRSGVKNPSKNSDGPSEASFATWSRGDDDMEPSTKMLQMFELLKQWEAKGDKTIIYSQWTSMLDLIERMFSRHGIRNLRFDGKMDRTQRDATLATFKQPGGPKVLLISTKCGSVGLNLVVANRIINMDLSWNYAAESQAYDRCHRIGQEKPVFVKRLVVQNTIEERMLRLQDVKTGLADAALGEGSGGKLHKLSVKDIRYLFNIGPRDSNTLSED
ncbi:SNF2 family N-terminal domain-containing protein [Crepidotus variabilis]|uniref:SNF2 family N-terminal domain-containing protein n=1 Tax=Crepidotus variabilis TaxID=179855 RepID=A0A9P6EFV7_9AGAR|nr:SNF2 family N-terminal domain-containing protein [Crepidotus variabilis]